MINSFLKLEERLPPIRAHRPGGSRSAAWRGRLVPHLNTPLCIFLQPLGAKALHKANLEIHPLAQQVHWVSNHIFLTTCSVNRRGKHWSQVTMGPSKWDWCQWRLHRCLVCISHSVVVDSLSSMDCSRAGSSVHGILQTRILELQFPSPGDLLDPGIEPMSPALQVDSLLSQPPGKPQRQPEGTVKVIEWS